MGLEPWLQHGLARVVLSHDVGGTIQRNVFHVLDLTGTATTAHYQAILDAFAYWWAFPDYGADAGCRWSGHNASLVDGALLWLAEEELRGVLRVLTPVLPVLGASDSVSLPANASPAITWYCAFGGHKGRGRTYLAGFPIGETEGGNANRVRTSAAPLIEATYNALLATLRDATSPPGMFELVIYHRAGRSEGGGAAVYGDPIVRARFRDLSMDSQRARLPGHRRNLT